jgi:tetratricopeptide (TPR) repeat protein
MAYQDKGDPGHALEDYNRAIELDPEHVQARYNRASLQVKQGMLARAFEDVRTILRFDERNVKAMALAGKLHLFEGSADLPQSPRRSFVTADYCEAVRGKGDAVS